MENKVPNILEALKGEIKFSENYVLQLVPIFSPGSYTCTYKFFYDPENTWELIGKHELWRTPTGGSFYLFLWHKVS